MHTFLILIFTENVSIGTLRISKKKSHVFLFKEIIRFVKVSNFFGNNIVMSSVSVTNWNCISTIEDVDELIGMY